MAKLARFLTNQVRLDTENDISSNGEVLVQSCALQAERPVVLDVGAHYGEWSNSLLAQQGNRPVLHLFEPSAHSARRAASALGERALVHQIAMSEKSGVGILHIAHQGAGSNSVVAFSKNARVPEDSERIKFSTVGDFCSAQGIDRVRLLKVDAEGHDLAVLRGSEKMLARQAIDLIQFEYNHRWIDARVFLADAFELLQTHGYCLGKVSRRGIEAYPAWHPELEKFVEGNYLAYIPDRAVGLRFIRWWGP